MEPSPLTSVSFCYSRLEHSDATQLKIYMPIGFRPAPNCGGSGQNGWSREYDQQKFLNGASALDPALKYNKLPENTRCRVGDDPADPDPHIIIEPGGVLQYGLDYAFMFKIINSITIPPINTWRFQTMLDGVLLHLDRSVMGFELQELQYLSVTPEDTTRSEYGLVRVIMRSAKRISGTIFIPPPKKQFASTPFF